MTAATLQHSCLYRGWVRHERCTTPRNGFVYPTFMTFLSLNELDVLEQRIRGFSTRRPAPIWLRRTDHVGDPGQSIRSVVDNALEAHGLPAPAADIRLLTNLRYWGHCFNPISVYYCYREPLGQPYAAVLEVTNTPWGQRHIYVVPMRDDESRYQFQKDFHVSPFLPADMQYHSYLIAPGERLQLAINNMQGGECSHRASLVLNRERLTATRLWRRALAELSITARNLGRIYWQAAKLVTKGARYYRHPGAAASGNANQ